jgi:LysR family cys regulon transcriptional activator
VNIQQLRYVCEVARLGLNVSRAALALHTSQPGVSSQIRQLEEELGFAIFLRKQNRLVGLTPEGSAAVEHAQRALAAIGEIRDIGRHHQQDTSGSLVIAASHTQARFVLPPVLQRLLARYPQVQVTVQQGGGRQTSESLLSASADIGILSSLAGLREELRAIACNTYRHILLVPAGHPLLKLRQPALTDIVQHPMVLYQPSKTGQAVIDSFESQRIPLPRIVRGSNADVVKSFVEHGLGVAVLPDICFDPERDQALRAIDVSHLFLENTVYLVLHRNHYLRGYGYDFIEMLAPHLTRQVVQNALAD